MLNRIAIIFLILFLAGCATSTRELTDAEVIQEYDARKYLEVLDACIKSGYCDVYCQKGKGMKAAADIRQNGIPENGLVRIRRYEQIKGRCRVINNG